MIPLNRKNRRHVVGEYVRDRLRLECKAARGKAFELSKEIGFSPSHLSAVMAGDRGVGEALAMALARHWSISYEELERLAFDEWEHRVREQQSSTGERPNLTATLTYCRETYPDAYLSTYLRYAGQLPHDRPRELWFQDIQVQYWDWKYGGLLAYQVIGKDSPNEKQRRVPVKPYGKRRRDGGRARH